MTTMLQSLVQWFQCRGLRGASAQALGAFEPLEERWVPSTLQNLGPDIVGRGDSQLWVAVSDGTQFINEFWGEWSDAIRWIDVQVGDVNGDGRDDYIARDFDTGNWWVGFSDGLEFVPVFADAWSPFVTWDDVMVGDINGDQLDDIVGRVRETGHWWGAISDGGGFNTQFLGGWSTAVQWVDVYLADLDGDSQAEIVGRAFEIGEWWAAFYSPGVGLTNEYWATWSTSVDWVDVQVADIDGDQRDDVVGRDFFSGEWWVGLSTTIGFVNSRFGQWSPSVEWVDVMVTDVNFDGPVDIVGRVLGSGDWWVGLSNGQSFANAYFGTWSPFIDWQDVQNGDFLGPPAMQSLAKSGSMPLGESVRLSARDSLSSGVTTWEAQTDRDRAERPVPADTGTAAVGDVDTNEGRRATPTQFVSDPAWSMAVDAAFARI